MHPAGHCFRPYLLVISKVVPKIWARTNSAMVKVLRWIQTAVGEVREGTKCSGSGMEAAVVAKLAAGWQD